MATKSKTLADLARVVAMDLRSEPEMVHEGRVCKVYYYKTFEQSCLAEELYMDPRPIRYKWRAFLGLDVIRPVEKDKIYDKCLVDLRMWNIRFPSEQTRIPLSEARTHAHARIPQAPQEGA